MNIIGIIQARMGSTRLPGKVLKEVLGKPLLWFQTERLKLCKKTTKIIIATSRLEADNQIEKFCRDSSLNCFRGEEDDVLDRYYRCASLYKADVIVRITADCPLLDPYLTDKIIDFYLNNPAFDLVRTGATYPEGMGVEVFPFHNLEIAWREARIRNEREHVTVFLWKNDSRFKIKDLSLDKDCSFLRLTVDEELDFQVIKEVIEELYPTQGPAFTFDNLLALYQKKPQIFEKNMHLRRKEEYFRSLKEE